jgi:hypothetical protein
LKILPCNSLFFLGAAAIKCYRKLMGGNRQWTIQKWRQHWAQDTDQRQTKQKPQETKKTQICLLQVKGMAFNYTLQFTYLHSVLKSKEQEKSVGCRINFFFSNFR